MAENIVGGRIIYETEIDTNPFRKGAQFLREEQGRLQQKAAELKASTAGLTTEYNNSLKSIATLKQQIADLGKNTDLAANQKKAYTSALRQAQRESQALSAQIRAQKNEFSALTKEMKGYDAILDPVTKKQSLFSTIVKGGIAVAGITSLTSAVAGFGSTVVKNLGEFEAFSVSLERLTGSAQEAQRIIKGLEKLDLESAFSIQALQAQSVTLLAQGFKSSEVLPTLERLGNLAQGSEDKLRNLALAYSQVRAAGKLGGQEFNQFVNAGFPIAEFLSKVLGKKASELKGNIADLGITFEQVEKAIRLATDEGGRFFELNKQIATTTVQGAISNLSSALYKLQISLGTALREPILAIVNALNSLINGLLAAPAIVSKYRVEIGLLAASITLLGSSFINLNKIGFVLPLLTNLANVIRQVAQAITLAAVANPYTAIASGLLAIAGAASIVVRSMDSVSSSIKAQNELTEKANGLYIDEVSKIESLRAVIDNEKLSRDQRTQAVKELKAIYPEFLSQFSEEEFLAGRVSEAYNVLTISIKEAARARAAQELVQDKTKQLLQKELELVKNQESLSNKSIIGGVIDASLLGNNTVRKQFDIIKDIKELREQIDVFASQTTDKTPQLLQQRVNELRKLRDEAIAGAGKVPSSVLKTTLDAIEKQLSIAEKALKDPKLLKSQPAISTPTAKFDKKAQEKVDKAFDDFDNYYNSKIKEQNRKLTSENSVEDNISISARNSAKFQSEIQEIAEKEAELRKKLGAEFEKRGLSEKFNELKANESKIRELTEYKERIALYEKRIQTGKELENQITDLENEGALERIQNAQKSLNQESFLIDEQLRQRKRALEASKLKDIKGLEDSKNKGLIGDLKRDAQGNVTGEFADAADEARFQQIKLNITEAYNTKIAQSDIDANNKKLEIGLSYFEKSQKDIADYYRRVQDIISVGATQEINTLTEQYSKGELSYEQYQKRLSDILRRESTDRLIQQKNEIKRQIEAIKSALESGIDTGKGQKKPLTKAEKEKLQGELVDLEAKQGGIDRQISQDKVSTNQSNIDAKVSEIKEFASAYGQLAESIIGFWSSVNEAERRALENSISIQERRVSNATILAQRGNAELLEQEQEKLNRLTSQREAFTRRQIQIDNALRVSQSAVVAISAIADGVAKGGVVGAVIAGASILALISSVYGLVSSLGTNVPAFFDGTTYLTGNAPQGRDKHLIRANEGEAIIPTQTNAEYHPAVKAIYHKTIPASVLNDFVGSYPNYENIGSIASYIVQNGETNALLRELIGHYKETVLAMKKFEQVSINLDQQGFALSMLKMAAYESKSKKM